MLRSAITTSEVRMKSQALFCEFTHRKKNLNGYYQIIHPYLPLLPPSTISPQEDNPSIFQPSPEVAGTVKLSCLPYQPSSSFSLAVSAILALIPPPQDQDPADPCSVWLRRSYAQLFAQTALHKAENEIEEPTASTEEQRFHPQLSPKLHPILALVVLSVYDYCQHGNISRMRMRANQAVTTAMDYSIHCLNDTASEAQRRIWWNAVFVMYQSTILNASPPVITINDPRITTPYPSFQSHIPEPWSALLRVNEASVSVSEIVNSSAEGENTPTRLDPRDQIHRLDSHLLTLAAECDSELGLGETDEPDELAAWNLGLITNILSHSARIKLHRRRAFAEVPIFVQKHCDLAFVNTDEPFSQTETPRVASYLESIFPFSVEESSKVCLKSSLAISRAFGHLNSLALSQSNYLTMSNTITDTSLHQKQYGGSLPYFKCAAMQACYSLYMLVHHIRAALSSKRLSICYFLLNQPDPATEVQDAKRPIEELRNGISGLISSMKLDMVFDGITAMTRDLDAVYLSLFPR
ncbi:hypothetical protein BO71DRAFT_44932 [Aspergillus ellipticus CBS 707.79]|uniref:Transcription factor domain-containing protein n=1 Tax=Aspergillus ellipticus CBS 707.79 TaxID=1448320 RepID=A0A319EKW5_9EURO|nr:hypothetical protein BO71DRAFT_44932 [Aspergillus ellipticus CBS 707.79]